MSSAVAAGSTPLPTWVFVFTTPELTSRCRVIRTALGPGTWLLNSPRRIEDALVQLFTRRGGSGVVVVHRSPAALLTPEYWRVELRELDGPARLLAARLLEAPPDES